MKQIYGFATRLERDVDATLRELHERVTALEIQLAELRRADTDRT
jgi:hypothetical protein